MMMKGMKLKRDHTLIHNVKNLLDSAGLHFLQAGLVTSAYVGPDKELGLFHLFLTRNYLETVLMWTNEALQIKGKKDCSIKEFYAYLGLEMGMWYCRSLLDQFI